MKFFARLLVLALIVGVSQSKMYEARVDYVIDGDTVVLEDGTHVRLLQINAPERGECGYEEATNRLRELVGHKVVKIEQDPLFGNEDKYKRTLAYLHVGDVNVNVELQREGYVNTLFYNGVEGKYAYLMNGPGPCSR